MRLPILALILCSCFLQPLFSQTPELVNYQAVIRNSAGEIVADANISLKLEVISDAIGGETIYSETHNLTTSSSGIVSTRLGNGASNDSFDSITWGEKEYFLQVSVDVSGGNTFELLGSSQIVSVPYALHAKKSSSTKVPRLTQSEIDLGEWTDGDFIYNKDEKKFLTYEDGFWYGDGFCGPDPKITISVTMIDDSTAGVRLSDLPSNQGFSSFEWKYQSNSSSATTMSITEVSEDSAVFKANSIGAYLLGIGGSHPCYPEYNDYNSIPRYFSLGRTNVIGSIDRDSLMVASQDGDTVRYSSRIDTSIVGNNFGALYSVGGASSLPLGTIYSSEAMSYCHDLVADGYDDWFLPSVNLMQAVVQNQDILSSPLNYSSYWVIEESPSNPDRDAYLVGSNGNAVTYFKNSYRGVRCVRRIE